MNVVSYVQITHWTCRKKFRGSNNGANNVTTRAKWLKNVLFEKNYAFFLNVHKNLVITV